VRETQDTTGVANNALSPHHQVSDFFVERDRIASKSLLWAARVVPKAAVNKSKNRITRDRTVHATFGFGEQIPHGLEVIARRTVAPIIDLKKYLPEYRPSRASVRSAAGVICANAMSSGFEPVFLADRPKRLRHQPTTTSHSLKKGCASSKSHPSPN